MMETITFEEVKLHGYKAGKCACGKRRTRSTIFSQTINPWNKNKQGQVKSRAEILQELLAERKVWEAAPIYCQVCRPAITYK